MLAQRVGFDLPCGAGRLGLQHAPACFQRPSGSNPNGSSSKKKKATLTDGFFFLAQQVGFDLRCGGGRVAALRRPRRLIHSRSRSNPTEGTSKNKRPTLAGEPFVFGAAGGIRTHVGFRPNGFRDRPVMTASIPLRIHLFENSLERSTSA